MVGEKTNTVISIDDALVPTGQFGQAGPYIKVQKFFYMYYMVYFFYAAMIPKRSVASSHPEESETSTTVVEAERDSLEAPRIFWLASRTKLETTFYFTGQTWDLVKAFYFAHFNLQGTESGITGENLEGIKLLGIAKWILSQLRSYNPFSFLNNIGVKQVLLAIRARRRRKLKVKKKNVLRFISLIGVTVVTHFHDAFFTTFISQMLSIFFD